MYVEFNVPTRHSTWVISETGQRYKYAHELAPVQRGDVGHVTLPGVSYERLTVYRLSVERQATKETIRLRLDV